MPKKKRSTRYKKQPLPPLELDFSAIDNPNKCSAVKQAIYEMLLECGPEGYTANEMIDQLKGIVEGIFTLRYIEPILDSYVNQGQVRKSIRRQWFLGKPKITISLSRPGLLYRPVYKKDSSFQYRDEVYFHYISPEKLGRKPKKQKQTKAKDQYGKSKKEKLKKTQNHKGISKLLNKWLEYKLNFKGQKLPIIAKGNDIQIPLITLKALPIEPTYSGEIPYTKLLEIYRVLPRYKQDEMHQFMGELAQLQKTLNTNMDRFSDPPKKPS